MYPNPEMGTSIIEFMLVGPNGTLHAVRKANYADGTWDSVALLIAKDWTEWYRNQIHETCTRSVYSDDMTITMFLRNHKPKVVNATSSCWFMRKIRVKKPRPDDIYEVIE